MASYDSSELSWQSRIGDFHSRLQGSPEAIVRLVLEARGVLHEGGDVLTAIQLVPVSEMSVVLREVAREARLAEVRAAAHARRTTRPGAPEETFDDSAAETGPITLPRTS